jgi:hypothetical protein
MPLIARKKTLHTKAISPLSPSQVLSALADTLKRGETCFGLCVAISASITRDSGTTRHGKQKENMYLFLSTLSFVRLPPFLLPVCST